MNEENSMHMFMDYEYTRPVWSSTFTKIGKPILMPQLLKEILWIWNKKYRVPFKTSPCLKEWGWKHLYI